MNFGGVMHKKYGLISVLPMLAFSQCVELYGQTHCHEGTVNHLNANGMVSLSDTQVLGNAHVRGQLTAQGAQFESLSIQGTAELNHVKASKDLKVQGFLVMKDTKATQVTVTSNRLELYRSEVDAVNVLKHRGEPQTIVLGEHTKVKGDIHFEQGNGEVMLAPTAQIFGQITGGKVVN